MVHGLLKDRSVEVLVINYVWKVLSISFSMPQGLCAGPVVYNIYSSTPEKLIQGFLLILLNIQITKYSNIHLNMMDDEDRKQSNLEDCLSRITDQTQEKRFKVNNDNRVDSLQVTKTQDHFYRYYCGEHQG